MRAVRYYGRRDVRLDSVPAPACGPHEVRLAPAYVGLCGSDVHEFAGGPISTPLTPHPLTGATLPVTLGHEFSATVREVGSEVTGLRPGARVAVQPTLACGACPPCRAGAENVCHSGGFVGLSGGAGGLADECCVAARRAFELPEGVSLRAGALVEPLAVASHAADLAPVPAEGVALVLGAGPIGLGIALLLHARQPRVKVVVSEPAAARRELALRLGATAVLDPGADHVVAEVARIAEDGGGADVVFDCAGAAGSIRTAMLAVRARGAVVNVALWEGEVPFNPNLLLRREVRYLGSAATEARDFERVVEDLGRGGLRAEELITGVRGMDEVPAVLEELLGGQHVKVLIEVNGEGSK